MKVLIIFFSILPAMVVYAQDDQSGFISLDCGSPQGPSYTENTTGINYVSDDGFIAGGVSQVVFNCSERVYNTIRSFPENKRNCYTLRPQKGKNNRYLIRAMFYYGESRGHPPLFDLYIGADYWAMIYIPSPASYYYHEMIHLASSDYIYVCLINTDRGDPFITSLELRLLDVTMYNDRLPSSLFLLQRIDFSTSETVRYEDDKYDRIWYPATLPPDLYRAIQTSDTVSLKPFSEEQVPLKVMSTAITPVNSTYIHYNYQWSARTSVDFMVYIQLAEVEILERNQKREFNIYNNGRWIGTVSPSTNITTVKIYASSNSPTYELILNRTLNSTLPPILNALEIYALRQLQQNQTDDQDAAAILSTKSTYGLTKLNWQGDPCVPQENVWVGLNCNYDASRAARIVSLNLSSRGLIGEIATALANLTMIESLDLSYNKLTGNVPNFLAQLNNLRILNLVGNNFTRPLPAELLEKSKKGSLSLSTDEEGIDEEKSSCLKGSCRNNNNKIVVILAPIIGGIVVLSIIVLIVIQMKRKALIKKEELFIPSKQRFTYSEVVSITNNFQNEIGRGGFGSVFRGSVGNNQVAVKMLSESSSQGYKEFQTEVKLLIKIHHTNITSLVGYCDDRNHKGIIYEFMANGNLGDHLFDGSATVLSWERRLQIGCDAAEGLAYLHHGCRPPIVHRDVKPSNILLNEGFHAKLADFGLSRAFATEDATHITSIKVAGTLGYLDPEYHATTRLTEKSDVYSFGVLLLELITSRRVISEGVNIVQWVKSQHEVGNVETIIDSRLDGRFDIKTAEKVVETAIACVSPKSIKRPTMNDVVMDLKHCLRAERTRQSESMSLNFETMGDLIP
ncbi:putative LRR receptor-like serine/threonine-protein kinase At1g05700 isoform X2 [Bidens hawaiensis]|uniref:putative LRR receptor-like serine/threonine-protein kinase At1g05700 isoform X2 n=1 Tax=Bidens hawaiensis TaxID=980011 RepID=UPI00404A0BDC